MTCIVRLLMFAFLFTSSMLVGPPASQAMTDKYTCPVRSGPIHCGHESSCRKCNRDLIGVCMSGKFKGRLCKSAADVLLCREGGGQCVLFPQEDDGSPQHAFPSCKTNDDGKCECQCKGIFNLGLCEIILTSVCESSGLCKCDDSGTCTFRQPCAN